MRHAMKVVGTLAVVVFLAAGCGSLENEQAGFEEFESLPEQGFEEADVPVDELQQQEEFLEGDQAAVKPPPPVTCPVTINCQNAQPAGGGWIPGGTVECPNPHRIHCKWFKITPFAQYAYTSIAVPPECPICDNTYDPAGYCDAAGNINLWGTNTTWVCDDQ